MKHTNSREKELQPYFSRPNRTKMGLPDALGFEELSAIRGVKDVAVQLIHKRQADVCTISDKVELLRWLESRLKASDKD
jgi:hypothetical protein